MSTGTHHDLLLLCAVGERRVVQGLAKQLKSEGLQPKVQTVAPLGLAGAIASALEQAPLVLLAVSSTLKDPLAEVLAGEMANALPSGRWLVLQLDEGEIGGLPAAVVVIAWPRQLKGDAKKTRETSLARIRELAGAEPDAAPALASEPANTSGSNRDNFKPHIRRALSRRVGDFCSKPGCRNHTSGPHSDPGKVADTGVAAHITAAAPGGPRYDPQLTSEERSSADNGIWLCQNHAKLIDSDPATYPEALLREWKAWAESEQQDRQNGIHRSRSDWTWPGAWDFGPYRKERRQGFVGREWLLQKLRAWAADPEAKQALLIGADFGVGKTAFLAKLLDQENEVETQIEDKAETQEGGVLDAGPGLSVVAQHFCNSVENSYLSPGRFVQSLAAQLKEQLPAYRKALEDDSATSLRESLNRAEAEPLLAFQQAVVAPLAKIPAPATRRLLAIDALDEALDYRPEAGSSNRYTIVDLLAKEARNLPTWLRVLATSRRHDEVLKPLRAGFFSIEEINAEEAENLADIHAYVKARCEQEPLTPILSLAGLSASDTADVLQAKSGGKFLYAVRVLNDLASGALTLENRQSLDALPPGMDGFYADTFLRRFPETGEYDAVKPLLALLCAQREPMGYGQLAAILEVSIDQIVLWIEPLQDLLRFQATPPSERASENDEEWRISFDHASLEQWLTERSGGHIPRPRAGRFGVNRKEAEHQIHTWALAEVEAGHAHITPYLVRHLASHLRDDERAEMIAGQLRQFPWLQARLRLAGLNALLGDFDPLTGGQASLPPELQRLGRALRQAAHVLSHQDGWNGEEQLASQLLARRADDGPLEGWREQLKECLQKAGSASPHTASLLATEAQLRTLRVECCILALIPLSDGRLASGGSDGIIRLWDLSSGKCSEILLGHKDWVNSLVQPCDGRLASCSSDGTIRIWNVDSRECLHVLEGHKEPVNSLVMLKDGRIASGSDDKSIRLWDTANGECTNVLLGHEDWIRCLEVLNDGSLASGSDDGSIRIWDPVDSKCTAILKVRGFVTSLAVLRDGRLASGSSDCIIRLFDTSKGECTTLLFGHQNWVRCLAVLSDGRLASGSGDATVRIWNPTSKELIAILPGHSSWIFSMAALCDGNLASGSHDETIRLWHPASGETCSIPEMHEGRVNSIVLLTDGLVASGSRDRQVLLWNVNTHECNQLGIGHKDPVTSMAVLADGHLAYGSSDRIYIWNQSSGVRIEFFLGHECPAFSLVDLGNGLLAFGSSDMSIRLLDTARNYTSGSTYSAYIAVFEGHGGGVHSLIALSDGSLASGSMDNSVRIWDLSSGACKVVFDEHRGSVTALALLADGRLASGSYDQTIRLWDPASGSCSAVFEGHLGSVDALAVLGDGRLASGSYDKTIRLWDPRRPDGAPRVLFVADAAITALAWVPTHQLLVAGDASGRLHWLEMGSQQHSGSPSHQRP